MYVYKVLREGVFIKGKPIVVILLPLHFSHYHHHVLRQAHGLWTSYGSNLLIGSNFEGCRREIYAVEALHNRLEPFPSLLCNAPIVGSILHQLFRQSWSQFQGFLESFHDALLDGGSFCSMTIHLLDKTKQLILRFETSS